MHDHHAGLCEESCVVVHLELSDLSRCFCRDPQKASWPSKAKFIGQSG